MKTANQQQSAAGRWREGIRDMTTLVAVSEENRPIAGTPPQDASVGFVVPLVLGPLRGCWWQLASGGKIARVLLGTYESEQTAIFQQTLRPGDCVVDIGAAVGYYSLLAARLVGSTGHVIAVEPDPLNLHYLRAHLRQNRLHQVSVVPVALADTNAMGRFGGNTGTGTGRLCDDGDLEVRVARLDDVLRDTSVAPHHLKIDVEGAELAVLRGAERVIADCKPTIFLSTHDWIVPGMHRACCDLLADWGYRLQPIVGENVAAATELLCAPRRVLSNRLAA